MSKRFYIAGLDLRAQLVGFGLKKKVALFKNFIREIKADATASLGKEVIILIVLQEYAFTSNPIPIKEKKEVINLLQTYIAPYSNIVLIPGSFAAYGVISDEKREKIKGNYKTQRLQPFFAKDVEAINEYSNYKNNKRGTLYLENSTSIVTQNGRVTHKKSTPYKERRLLQDSVFYIGADNPIHKITVDNFEGNVAVLICREHCVDDSKYTNEGLKAKPPLIEIVISASIELFPKRLFGALNIQMDSNYGLTVIRNKGHFQANEIEDVQARYYYYDALDERISQKIEVSKINRTVNPSRVPDNNNQTKRKYDNKKAEKNDNLENQNEPKPKRRRLRY